MTDDLRSRLLDELAPTDEALERIRRRRASTDLPSPQGARRRRPRPSLRVRIAVAGAATVGIAIALSPFESDPARDGVMRAPAPASARAALEQAADAAASAPWQPLATGEFHHTITTTFMPLVPERDGDERRDIDRMFTYAAPTSEETWLDVRGHGTTIRAQGGDGDPDRYPKQLGTTGGGFGYAPTFPAGRPGAGDVDTELSLRDADVVDLTRTAGDVMSTETWIRTARGFERRQQHSGRAGAQPWMPADFGEALQERAWKATMPQVRAVNDASAEELDARVDRLLSNVPKHSSYTVPPRGLYGMTRDEVQEEQRVLRAVDLLGSAPLSPDARRAIFEWLSDRPTAKLEGPATDEAGRSGVEVVIERIKVRDVPGSVVTIDQLRRDYARSWNGRMPRGAVRGPKRIVVTPDHQYRRWYVSIVFDPESGELLQHVSYARQETTAQRPRLQRNTVRVGSGPQPPWRVAMAVDRQGMSDAVLYGIRERTRSVANVQTLACEVTPRMCS